MTSAPTARMIADSRPGNAAGTEARTGAGHRTGDRTGDRTRKARRLGKGLLAILGVSFLAACGSTPGEGLPCPYTAVLTPTDRVVKFRPGAGRDLTDVEYEARFVGIQGSCAYGETGVNVQAQVQMRVSKGPAMTGNVAQVEYFVALIRPQSEDMTKETFTSSIPFEGNLTQVFNAEELSFDIPLSRLDEGPAWRAYVGFQLTEEQLEYNRKGF